MAWTWSGLAFKGLCFYITIVAIYVTIPNRHIQFPDGRYPRGHYGISYGSDKYWSGWRNVKYLYVIGDSWSTDITQEGKMIPTEENPQGWDPSDWHIHGGEVWVEFLAAQHNRSNLRLANLAHGGATVDLDLIHPFASVLPGMTDLEDQVETTFAPFVDHPAWFPWTQEESLFIIFMGVNDIHNANEETSQLFGQVFEKFADGMDSLYQKGARNFMFVNVPPLEQSPLAEEEDRAEDFMEWVFSWNAKLHNLAANLTQTYDDTTAFMFDYYRLFYEVIESPCSQPETCEIKETKVQCNFYGFGTDDFDTKLPECEYRVDEYLWMNDIHPTTRMYNLTARVMADVLSHNIS